MSIFMKGLISGFTTTAVLVTLVFYGFVSNPDNAGLLDHYQYRDWVSPAEPTSLSNSFPGLGPYDSDLYFKPKDNNTNNENVEITLPTDPLFYLVPQIPGLTLSKNEIENICVWYTEGERPHHDRIGVEITFSKNTLNRVADHLKTYQLSNISPVLSLKDYEGTELAFGIPDNILIRRLTETGFDPVKPFKITYTGPNFQYGLLQYLSWSDYNFTPQICKHIPDNTATSEWFKTFIEQQVGFTEDETHTTLAKIKNGVTP